MSVADEQCLAVATLSLAEINAIRSDCFADDIPVEHRMQSWDEHELQHFLETDGLEAPEWEELHGPENAAAKSDGHLRALLLGSDSTLLSVPGSSNFVALHPRPQLEPLLEHGDLFKGHSAFRLPCDQPGEPPPRLDTIHRFELCQQFSEGADDGGLEGFPSLDALNASLTAWALHKEERGAQCANDESPGIRSDASMRVSNRGGYQSYPNMFIAAAEAVEPEHRRACRALHLIVSAAMDELCACGCASFPGVVDDHPTRTSKSSKSLAEQRRQQLYPADAWINVNRPGHHNVLHQHHPERWSAVYFVNEGAATSNSCRDGQLGGHDSMPSASGDYSGHLIFRGGPSKVRPDGADAPAVWSSHSFFAVPPSPGNLWIFSGQIPHGVCQQRLAGLPGEDSPARVSIALNYSTAKPPEPSAAGSCELRRLP